MTWALEHLPENPAIGQMAASAHMSRRTYYRMFKAATGTTPHRWLLSQRVILARRLLEITPLSVPQVADRSGFGEVSVLRRHFTRQVGISPATYRRRFGQQQLPATRSPALRPRVCRFKTQCTGYALRLRSVEGLRHDRDQCLCVCCT
jgi:transcriptional regulator GlxA family with amidase domain